MRLASVPRRLAILSILASLAAPAPALAGPKQDKLPPSTRFVLENGFEAILIPNRTVPLLTSVVVVRAGVARETPGINGISHMLEHLLFNGTARRTQEQIYDELDRYGIINNAHTGTDHTAYFVMATRDQVGRALDLQADMLFSSTFPQDKLDKERGIIVNEIAKDRLSDESAISELYASRLYHPGGLDLPVTGTPESVKEITRDEILDYYRAWYVPNNMTAVIMGDFDEEEMQPIVRRYFGAAAPGLLSAPASASVNSAALGLTHTLKVHGPARLVWLGAPAPPINASGSFERAVMLASLLGEDLTRAANTRLALTGEKGSFVDAEVGLDPHEGVSTFQIRATLDTTLGWAFASRTLLDEVTARLSAAAWKRDGLDRVRLGEKVSLMRLWEKPHYFGMDRAPYIAAAGWDLARDLVKRMSWVEPGDLKELARRLSDPKMWAVFDVGADAPQDAGAVSAAGGATGPGPPGAPTARSRDLVSSWKGPPSVADATAVTLPSGEAAARTVPVNVRTVLANGLQINVDWSDDSRVFAAHVLFKNRSAAEPAGKNGIVEMLHRLAGSGTRDHPGASLDEALRVIGGSLKVCDDAAIPYDDIYLSPEYSYMRLETLDEFAPEAIDLLREILSEPMLEDQGAIASAQEQLIARARQSEASPRERCRLLLARSLWGDTHPFARPLFGTERTIRSITAADLRAFHATYFQPRNIIIGIGTSVRPERLLPLLSARLGGWSTGAARGPRPAEGAATITDGKNGPRLVTDSVEATQSYLTWGRLAPASPVREDAFKVLASVLTRRMGDTLREKLGLAYALGADATMLAGRVQFTASMGVLPEKIDEARARLRDLLLATLLSPPETVEVESAIRATEVRLLMRNLSRINRAYARCLEEMRRSQDAPRRESGPTVPVSQEQVAAAAHLLLDGAGLDAWVEAVVRPPQETNP